MRPEGIKNYSKFLNSKETDESVEDPCRRKPLYRSFFPVRAKM